MRPLLFKYRWQIARIALVLLAMLPALATIWCVDILPTHDGPKNLYAAHVRLHLEIPSYAHEFEGRYPSTAFGFCLLYGAFQSILPWRLAFRCSWTVLLIGGAFSYLALVRSLDPRRWPLGILGFAAVMHWAVYMGFVNYLGGLALGFATLAVGLRARDWSAKREIAIALLMLATCAFHPIGAQLAGLGLTVYRCCVVEKGKRIRQLGALFLIGTPAMAVTIWSAAALDDLRAKGLVMAIWHSLTLGEAARSFANCFLSGPAWRGWPLVFAAALGCLGALVDLARRRMDAKCFALLVLSVGATIAVFATPLNSTEWEFFSPRFIPIAVLSGVALLPLERLGSRGITAFITLALAFDWASNAWAVSYNRKLYEMNADAYAAIGLPCKSGRTLFPIIALPYEPTEVVPYAVANINLGQLYGVDRRALTPYSFSNLAGLHLIERTGKTLDHAPDRDYGWFFKDNVDPAIQRSELVRVASFGAKFDDVLFYGRAEEADALPALGYAAELRRGGLFFGHFVGCDATVHISGARGQVGILAGWIPSERVVMRAEVSGDEAASFALPKVSCQGIWIRVIAGDDRCSGADADGDVNLATSVGTTAVLDCTLVTPAPKSH